MSCRFLQRFLPLISQRARCVTLSKKKLTELLPVHPLNPILIDIQLCQDLGWTLTYTAAMRFLKRWHTTEWRSVLAVNNYDKKMKSIHWYMKQCVRKRTVPMVQMLMLFPIVNRGIGYETLELSKVRTMLLQSMLNWPWPCTIFCFGFARVRKLVAHNLIEGFDWLSSRKKVCFVQGQGQKYWQKHETK